MARNSNVKQTNKQTSLVKEERDVNVQAYLIRYEKATNLKAKQQYEPVKERKQRSVFQWNSDETSDVIHIIRAIFFLGQDINWRLKKRSKILQFWEFKNLAVLEVRIHDFTYMHIAQSIKKNTEPMTLNFYL